MVQSLIYAVSGSYVWNVTPPYIHALHYVNKIYAHLWCKTFEYVASNHNMLQEQNETGTVKQPKPRTKAAASAPILNQQTLVEIRVCSFFRYGNADLSLGIFCSTKESIRHNEI